MTVRAIKGERFCSWAEEYSHNGRFLRKFACFKLLHPPNRLYLLQRDRVAPIFHRLQKQQHFLELGRQQVQIHDLRHSGSGHLCKLSQFRIVCHLTASDHAFELDSQSHEFAMRGVRPNAGDLGFSMTLRPPTLPNRIVASTFMLLPSNSRCRSD